jgi:ubiquinone/menaquinone biosynthesis C-methylase UbiE
VNETDRIAHAYSELETHAEQRWNLRNRGNQSILAERRRLTRKALERDGWVPLGDRKVLEVGSGTGRELAWLLDLGASPSRLLGIDLLADRVESARKAYPALEFQVANAEHLSFADDSFDLVLAITVFSSILDSSMASNVSAEINRVLRPGGALLWYDFRYDNPSNRDVRGVSAARVRALFPQLSGDLVELTLLPPIARRLGPLAPIAYPVLVRVPPLRSHLLGLLRKPSST